jgi:hypothetical protein
MTKVAPLAKRKPSLIFVRMLGALLLVAVALAPQPQARAGDAEAQCQRGDATLSGAYMSMGGGTIVGVGPITFIGTIYFDGKGGIVNPFTASIAGSILRASATGTYTINSDCSGTDTLTVGANNMAYDIRVSPDGSKVDYIETDSGTVASGSASRLKD